MDYVNTYAATLPLHMRGFYDAIFAASTEEYPFDKDIVEKLSTKQLGEKMIWLSGLPTARQLKPGERSPRASISTPYDKIWYTSKYGMAIVFENKQLDTDQSGMLRNAMRYLGISHYNAYQRMVSGLLDNGWDTDYLGADSKPLFATDHPIANGRTTSNSSTAQALTPDAIATMLGDVKAQRTWHNEPWVESRGYTLVTGSAIEIKAHQILTATNSAFEFSNTPSPTRSDVLQGTGASIRKSRGNQFIQDPNAFWLIPNGSKNPLFVLTRKEVELREKDDVEFETTYNSQADRVAGWVHPWGVQGNEGA